VLEALSATRLLSIQYDKPTQMTHTAEPDLDVTTRCELSLCCIQAMAPFSAHHWWHPPPQSGLCPDGTPVSVDALQGAPALECSDQWFYGCWGDLPETPGTAMSECVGCCKYQHGSRLKVARLWSLAVPGMKGRFTEVVGHRVVRYLSVCPVHCWHVQIQSEGAEPKPGQLSFRLCAHDIAVETLEWWRVQGVFRRQ